MTVNPQDVVRITLDQNHIAFADKQANGRRAKAIERGRVPGNHAPTDLETALQIDILGMRGECAAFLWLRSFVPDIMWHWRVVENVQDLPDFDTFIDAKTVDAASKNLIIKCDDHDAWAYLLVLGHDHPRYSIVGWAWGYEGKSKPIEERKAGRRNHFVNQDDDMLRPPAELIELLKRRQAAWAAYRFNPGDETIRAALDATPCIQEAKAKSLSVPARSTG